MSSPSQECRHAGRVLVHSSGPLIVADPGRKSAMGTFGLIVGRLEWCCSCGALLRDGGAWLSPHHERPPEPPKTKMRGKA